MPNGFDGDTLQSYHIHENLFAEKENLMITVGRLGTPQKNTDMFLRALSQIDLKDWKVALIGPVEESFQPVIDSFFNDNPDKAKNVIFTGAIYEKQKLWEYYNRAKVFVLTSRWESYALVLNEAKRFRNYLLSTDVGAYRDLSENGKYGTSIPINDDKRLGEVLQDIIEGKINIDVYRNSNMDLLSWEKMVQLLKL
ncbi:glycosyltransferase [Bacteroidales bacterium SW292]|nr:glycosyltransferase [Bacteroidales bacterium SW292]